MNIVQIQHKVDFFLDAERSPRFRPSQKDKAINTAIMDIIMSRYDNIKKGPKEKEYAFQTSQRLRDELYTLVKPMDSLYPDITERDLIPKANLPQDYMFLVMLDANISGQSITTIPLTYDEYSVIRLNPFYRPSIVWPERIYRIEAYNGIKIVWGDVGYLIDARGYYISKPVTVKIGTEVSHPLTDIERNTRIIAYVDSDIGLYNSNGVLLDNISLKEGEEYTVGGASEYMARVTVGIVYRNSVDTDLPEALHEEISRIAAKVLISNVENYNREQSLERDINKQ